MLVSWGFQGLAIHVLSVNQLSTTFTQPTVRPKSTHILLDDYAALVKAINRMVALHSCDRFAWIAPVPTKRNGEYITS